MTIERYGRLFIVTPDGLCIMKGRHKWLYPTVDRCNYLRFTVKHDNHSKAIFVHRLIAETFIPNPNHYQQVNHKDEDKLNNNASNLEWCTSKYNSEYSRTRHPERERARWRKAGIASGEKRAKKVRAYKNGQLVAEYESVEAAARDIGCHRASIDRVAKGEYGYKTTHGLSWLFAPAEERKGDGDA